MDKKYKIHHSQLDETDSNEYLTCDSCGAEDSHASNGDCSYCSECHAVEQDFTTSWMGKDGELYRDNEIDWSGVPCIGCLHPRYDKVINGMNTSANHDNLPSVENRDTRPDGRCDKHPSKARQREIEIAEKMKRIGAVKVE